MVTQEQLDELWDFTDPVASENRLADAAQDQSSSPEARAELQTQVARALGLQSRFEDARRMLGRIIFDSPPVSSRVLLELGRILNSSGNSAEAVAHFASARMTAKRAGLTFLEVDALHMLAIADHTNAARWTEEALSVLDLVDEERTLRWSVSLHNNHGWRLHEGANYDEALTQFSLAMGAAARFGTADQRFAARWAYARCLRSLGRGAEALVLQQELVAERPEDASSLEELAILTAADAS